MDIGIGPLSCRRPDGTAEGMGPVYGHALDLAERADAVGFDAAWVAEHHFAADGYLSSPVSLCGAIAGRTGDFDVGIGLAVAPLHEPVKLAEDAAALNLLASDGGGSFTLGLGLGYRDIEYEQFGVDRRERVGWLLDAVETCRGAWSEGPMTVDGHLVDYGPVDVTPKPGSGISMMIGANADKGVERAGRLTDGYLAPPPTSPSDLEAKMAVAEEGLADRDISPDEFKAASMQYAAVHPEGKDAAWEAIREAYLYTRKTYLAYFNESSDSDLDFSEQDLADSVDKFEDRWRSDVIHGSPTEVAGQLRAFEDAWDGPVETILQLHYPGLEPEVSRQAVEYFGDEILPEF